MNEDGQKILLPEPTLRRLPWYLAYVNMLRTQKIEYVSSTQISRKINVDASQIAKDLSFLNIKGKTRIGYQVETLATELSNFLGFHNDHTAFMIGAGSLGSALIQDSGLMQFGLHIVAGFDVDEKVVGTEICGILSTTSPNFQNARSNTRLKSASLPYRWNTPRSRPTCLWQTDCAPSGISRRSASRWLTMWLSKTLPSMPTWQ